ncbi:amino acid permease-domain-containing protein [Mycena capillaripes]|nr:amino acid permease-domain-containing protein [Mycena capillaripes]
MHSLTSEVPDDPLTAIFLASVAGLIHIYWPAVLSPLLASSYLTTMPNSDIAGNPSGKISTTDDSALLAELGYRQEFKREFSVLELFGFGFSISAVVPSVSAVLVYSLPYGGGPAMIWGWATCSVFLMVIAFAMAELGSSAPTSGGVYYWTYKLSSPRYRNLMCWMVGYLCTLTYIATMAGTGWACATLINAAASVGSGLTYVPTTQQTFGVHCAVLLTLAVIASCATKIIARLQYLFIAINAALVAVMVIALPIVTPANLKNKASYAFGDFENVTTWPNGFAFILSFLAPLWSIGGFDVGVHISEEAKNANVAVPWAIIWVTAVGCTLGLGAQISVAFCMGTDTFGILSSPVQQPMATILLNSFGKTGMLVIWSFIIISLFMGGISLLTSASRQTFAFSRDGALPFAKYLYHINSWTGTPVRCVWFDTAGAMLLGLIPFAGPTAASAIFALVVVGQYIANTIPIAARYLGGQEFKRGPFHLGAFSFPIAALAVLFQSFMTVVLLFPAAPTPTAQSMNYAAVVVGGVLLLSLGYYYFPRYGGVHWFTGPVYNVDEMEMDENSAETPREKQ